MNHPHGRFECLQAPPAGLDNAVNMFGSFIPIKGDDSVHPLQWELAAITITLDTVVQLVRLLKKGLPAESPIAVGSVIATEKVPCVLHWLKTVAVCVREVRALRALPAAKRALEWTLTKARFREAQVTHANVTISGGSVQWPPSTFDLLLLCMNDDALEHDADLHWLIIHDDAGCQWRLPPVVPTPDYSSWPAFATTVSFGEVVTMVTALQEKRQVTDPIKPNTVIAVDKVTNVLDWLRTTPVCVKEVRALRNMGTATKNLIWPQVETALFAARDITTAVPGFLTRVAVCDASVIATCMHQSQLHDRHALAFLMSSPRSRA